jgi:dTDP-4-amino-4,6-dideoxygalactose transaminase
LADRVRTLRTYGWGQKYQIDIRGGVNSRLDELQARFLSRRLRTLDEKNRVRRSIVGRYRGAAEESGLTVMPAEGEHSVAHLAIARTADRDRAVAHFTGLGIKTDVHFPIPDHLQPAYARGYSEISLPVTEKAAGEVLTLPCFPEMTDGEIDRVSDAIAAFEAER